ncbi:hypothetical protein PGT21_027590 [Puccinia graminis f. sp. tritici]|uniref:Uncharacterized protein n=1 Tax=Puccinia graminis f. sp. tritici TaxID=56615 RepID=A0A5B0QJR2_PUCGR|nr:hypothetical protein PGT21_027590 [Puccinia graminis f. sp. tritici]
MEAEGLRKVGLYEWNVGADTRDWRWPNQRAAAAPHHRGGLGKEEVNPRNNHHQT